MPTRRNATSTARGILRPDELARHASVQRLPCDVHLAPWVENYWHLTWHLPADTSFVSQTLPHPACTLSVELGHPRAGIGAERVVVTGVVTERFDVDLRDSGWVLGVKFRPGGLAALTGLDAGAVTDRIVPARDLVPDAVVRALGALTETTPADTAVATADAALLPLVPDVADADYELLLALVADMLADRTLLRVADVLERHGLSRRRTERLFARYVGVGPKWLLARYRLHDVVAALDAGYDGSLADLAASYGWYDQAHFNRDFVGLVGVTPSAYRAT